MNKNPFIQGFRQSTLTKNSQLILADVRGDGQGKLVIWSDENQQLIVYKGSNRQIQKQSKIKNANGIIQYIDQQRNPKAVIGISAENAFFIFRSLTQSFRLRIPDIVAEPEQQMLWSQYEEQPERLTEELKKLPFLTLSQTAKHFLSATTQQRKVQLIRKVFTDGINQKDSISAISVIRQSQQQIGNIIIATQMRRLYILDCYGHSIINQRIIESAPALLLAFGKYGKQYIIISIDREGDILIYLQEDKQKPSQKIKMASRVVSASFSYPQFLICTADQVISNYYINKGSIATKKYSFKLTKQPIKVLYVTLKNNKFYFVVFQDSFRMYVEKQLIYEYFTQHKLYDILFGSFAKQQNCLILLYDSHGFQVFILHRQFSLKQRYHSNKKVFSDFQNIPIPKKTTQFLQSWNQQRQKKDEVNSYKLFERSMLMLKWRTFKQKYKQKAEGGSVQLKFSSKILGLGPIFILKLQLQNRTDSAIYNLNLIWRYNHQSLSLSNVQKQVKMLPPNYPLGIQISVKSLTFLNQSIELDTFYEGQNGSSNISRTIIHIPNCEQFAQI